MVLETFGSLIKEEHLRTVSDGIIQNTLVLENKDPFPGYYGTEPSDKVPDSFFLMMAQKESTEKILRITDVIRKNSQLNFEGSPCRICIYNDTYNSIRVRGLSDFSKLAEIQNYYRDNGIVYLKKKKIDDKGIIQIKKIFKVEEINDLILRDSVHEMYYLKIKQQLTWSHFRTLTLKLKNNIPNSGFDAALAVIYGSEVLDLIRIYSKGIEMSQLLDIHSKYLNLIEKGY